MSPVTISVAPGFHALLCGWIPPLTVPWSANLLLVAGSIFLWFKNVNVALVLGITAALLGLTAWIFIPKFYQTLLVGYYFWQLSLVLFALGSFAIRRPTQNDI